MASQRGVRHLPRNGWAASGASFLTDVSSEMILNRVPLFRANVLGVKTAVIGLVEGVAEATAILLKLLAGRLSDRVGRKWLAVADRKFRGSFEVREIRVMTGPRGISG